MGNAGERPGRDARGDAQADTDARHDRLVDLGAFIRSQRELARMSVRKLADVAGVSNPYLSQIERGIRRPSADILQQLAEALRISVETLYVRAGILQPSRTHETTVTEAIERDPVLSPEQKQALINVYESFLSTAG
ncbi:MAG TPA: helix-turn-helix transcriptional regulator [Ilumatobacteraceae bacterium]|nr:helix-turn-helix transcriptional regulator [Ilumatobacteraceae bacterium]